jgi:phosphohistidine phosphatase
MKRLYLLRHAKSSWQDPGLPDQDRPLASRGRRATKLVAEHLRRERIAPSLVLCSPARRTRETLEGIATGLGEDRSVRVERELYGASENDLLERLRAIPDEVQAVMLIGHNPAIQELALGLARSGGKLARIERKYPTGALATLTFTGSWRELETAKLVDFVRPKDLEDAR